MDPFLSQIAKIYIEREGENMLDYCFVFPNKRSGMFFSKYLSENNNEIAFQPAITTISDLVLDFTDGVEASRMEQLFILYTLYQRIVKRRDSGSDGVDFDRFQYWGDVILSDFSDVDRYMADPSQLFKNIKDLREISSNFLTEEQVEVIKEYWEEGGSMNAIEEFWNHTPAGDNDDDRVSTGFIRLWQVLHELYSEFRKQLRQLGLTYSGIAYRDAADALKEAERSDLPYSRYVFIGFNLLSTSEIKIFERLQRIGCADFYWDSASPAFKDKGHRATRFLLKNLTRFKSLYDLPEPSVSGYPSTDIIGVPSNIGQVKMAGEIIKKLKDGGWLDSEEQALKTAIVLPDEELFIPLLHSIPPDVDNVNITMGYPLRHTPVAALISNIVSMQMRARRLHGEIHFYFEDIFTVLSHPLIRSIAPDDALAIVDDINKNRRYNIAAKEIAQTHPELASIFTPVRDAKNANEVFDYTINLLKKLKSGLESIGNDVVETGFASRYIEAVQTLQDLSERYDVTMSDTTFFHLMEKLVGTESVSFIGEPLKGVQIMGVLETRALDFDNVIMLSMNERVFPRKHYTKTFIPNALRHGYGMSTIDYQESIYSYYFYRLITRAKNVYLIYDTRTGGLKGGEMSRYLYQLLHLFPHDNLRQHLLSYDMKSVEPRVVEAVKTPEIMDILNRYRDSRFIDEKYFSPTSIDHYIQCPLQFYLAYIRQYNIDDELKIYMDEGTYGTIIHEVAQNIYETIRREKNGTESTDKVRVTATDLDRFVDEEHLLQRMVTQSINKNYSKEKDLDTPLTGENKIIGIMMVTFIKRLIEHDKKFTPFNFIAAEKRFKAVLPLTETLSINIKGSIDRIDEINIDDNSPNVTRLIDYKTGSDNPIISKWEQIFDTGNSNHQKSVLQLMLYANAYQSDPEIPNDDNPIMPVVYKLKDIGKGDRPCGPVTIAKCSVNDYRDFNEEFIEGLGKRMEELFDPNIPFKATPDKNACRYCKFTQICAR